MGEEFKHFGMDLEFLIRRSPRWRDTLKGSSSSPATSSNTATRPKRRRKTNRPSA